MSKEVDERNNPRKWARNFKLLGFNRKLSFDKSISESIMTSEVKALGNNWFEVDVKIEATVTTAWSSNWDGSLDLEDIVKISELTDYGIGHDRVDSGAQEKILRDERKYKICCSKKF